ncbi:hypothetical protein AA313_de0209218 [Arthrobotrys entomopaga]|nr:hypothetical protein AA313_de0209218 [Arthrobotrys entomopaga]
MKKASTVAYFSFPFPRFLKKKRCEVQLHSSIISTLHSAIWWQWAPKSCEKKRESPNFQLGIAWADVIVKIYLSISIRTVYGIRVGAQSGKLGPNMILGDYKKRSRRD